MIDYFARIDDRQYAPVANTRNDKRTEAGCGATHNAEPGSKHTVPVEGYASVSSFPVTISIATPDAMNRKRTVPRTRALQRRLVAPIREEARPTWQETGRPQHVTMSLRIRSRPKND